MKARLLVAFLLAGLLLPLADTNSARRRTDYLARRRAMLEQLDWDRFLGRADWNTGHAPAPVRMGRAAAARCGSDVGGVAQLPWGLDRVARRLIALRDGVRFESLPLRWGLRGAALRGRRLLVTPDLKIDLGRGCVGETYVRMGVPLEGRSCLSRTSVHETGLELRAHWRAVRLETGCDLRFREGAAPQYEIRAQVCFR
ncbi:MAG: hypothetical protein GF330_01980 [Candidatus Eisenbacteria bacterium]|nr:hypothetical protein [Candidatus Eisenbacteria bacterium]